MKTQLEKVEAMLKAHSNSFQHNKVPHETGRYIQLMHNPVVRDQFITVQLVVRLKKIDLVAKQKEKIQNTWFGFKNKSDGLSADSKSQAKSAIDVAIEEEESKSKGKIEDDKGRNFYRFRYETCKSRGPSLHRDFKDPDGTLDGVGDGKWEEDEDEEEDCCEHQEDSTPCECPSEREYLVITFWCFNEALGLLEVLHEYSVQSLIGSKGNQHPLQISQQAQVAFWFERNAEDQLVYREIPLDEYVDEPQSVIMDQESTLLKEMLSDCQVHSTFTLSRINTAADERILVYSIANPSSDMIDKSRFRAQINDSLSQITQTESHWNFSTSQINKESTGLFELVFFSLDSCSTIHSIPDTDSILEYDSDKHQVWVLGLINDNSRQGLVEQVCLVQLKAGKRKPSASDYLEQYKSSYSELEQYRFCYQGLIQTYFSSQHRKLVMVKGNKATIYFLDSDKLRRANHTAENGALFICKSEDESDAFLLQMQKRPISVMSSEEMALLPAYQDMYELHFFDFKEMESNQSLSPSFEETIIVKKGFQIQNIDYQQALYMNEMNEVMGPLHDGDRYNFSFVRSYVKNHPPLQPALHSLATIKYPCIMHCTPFLTRKKVFLQNFYHPDDIHILDLGQWRLVTFVENCILGEDLGQSQTFTAIVTSPENRLCIVSFKMHPFEDELHDSTSWQVLGEIRSLTEEPVETDTIVLAKLIQTGSDLSVIVQYDGNLLALKVLREISGGPVKSKTLLPQSVTNKRAPQGSRFDHIAATPRQRNGNIQKLMEPVVQKISHQIQYTFGRQLALENELQTKRILLSMHGNKVYFVTRNTSRKVDQIKSIELLHSRKDDAEDSIQVNIETVFESTSRIIYIDFDTRGEVNANNDENDIFFVINSDKKIHRLLEKRVLVEGETAGQTFTKKNVYKCVDTIDLETKLGQSIINGLNLDKIFNDKYPFFNITMRMLQYKNFTVGFDSGVQVQTLMNERVDSVRAIRNTTYVGGFCKQPKGTCIFFAKPNMGQRAVDCFGVRGPKPEYTHIVGNGLIIFSWKDYRLGKYSSKIFNSQGRFLGMIEQPRLKQSDDPQERVEDLQPIAMSSDSQYFLLAKKDGKSDMGAVSQLKRSATGQYKFSAIEKLFKLGSSLKGLKGKFFQVTKTGKLFSIKLSYRSHDSREQDSLKNVRGCICKKSEHWTQYLIELPRLGKDDDNDELPEEKVSDIHVELTETFIVLIRRNGEIIKIKRKKLPKDNLDFLEKKIIKNVQLPIAGFIEDKNEIDEIGLKWINKHDLVQFKLKQCLLLYDIHDEKEITCLNNYEGTFDDPSHFILTPFYVPARKNDKSTRQYIEMSTNQSFIKDHRENLLGRIYKFHDELSIHTMLTIAKKAKKGKQLQKLDMHIAQCIYTNQESVFHIFANQFFVLQRLHKQICGTDEPGETNEVDHSANGTTKFNNAQFRRIVQAMLSKNQDGASALNLAIQQKNFRCFELMLSILLNASDTFISRNFLSDLGNMMELEAVTVENFFERKLVDNFASIAIEKVKWTLEQEQKTIVHNSSVFNKKLIEQHTAPGSAQIENEMEKGGNKANLKDKKGKARKTGIHGQLDEQKLTIIKDSADMAMKAVDVKLLDLDWLFDYGNAQKFVWMLSLTSNEGLFKSKQVITVIDLLWEQYQNQIREKVFKPYVVYFVTTLIYFSFFLRASDQSWSYYLIEISLRVLVVMNMVFFEMLEYLQISGAGVREYVTDAWNTFDQISFLANAATLVIHSYEVDDRIQKIVASFAMLMMYVKLFYWLRLFENTAAFIRILAEIQTDIKPFLTFLLFAIAMFANSTLLLDQSRLESNDGDGFITPVFGIPFLDAFIRTYLVALGEYEIDQFTGFDSPLVWIYFLMATFIVQIIFMNLLIAIMGDTFDRVQDLKVQAATKEKIAMMKDFIWVIDMEEEFKNKKHVLIIEQQILSTNTTNAWDGKVGQLKSHMQSISQNSQSQIKQLQNNLAGRIGTTQDGLKRHTNGLTSLSQRINQIDFTMKKSLSGLNKKIDQLLGEDGGQQAQQEKKPHRNTIRQKPAAPKISAATASLRVPLDYNHQEETKATQAEKDQADVSALDEVAGKELVAKQAQHLVEEVHTNVMQASVFGKGQKKRRTGTGVVFKPVYDNNK